MIRHDIEFDKKDKSWALHAARFIFDNLPSLSPNYFWRRRDALKEIVDYALGDQSVDRYKPIFSKESKDVIARLSKISFKPLSLWPNFRRIAIERIEQQEYIQTLNPIDPISRSEYDKELKQIEASILLQRELKKIDPALAEDVKSMRPADEPADMDAFEMYKNFSFKYALAANMEQAIEYSRFISGYDDLRSGVISDLFDFGVGCIKVWMDESGSEHARRCRIGNMVVGYSDKSNYSDAPFIGEVLFFMPHDIISKYRGSLSDDEIEVLKHVSSPSKYSRNTKYSSGDCYIDSKYIEAGFIPVMDIELKTPIVKKYRSRVSTAGNPELRPTDKSPQRDDVVVSTIETIYRIKWVVGSNIVLEWGKAPNQHRSNDGLKAEFSYKIYAPYQSNGIPKGLGSDVLPIIDFIQLNWLKLLDSLSQSVPSGYALNLDALEDVDLTLDGQDLSVQGLIKLFFSKGHTLYRRKGLQGNPEHLPPVSKNINGPGPEVEVYVGNINVGVNMLRKVAGMNELTDGSSPDPRILSTPANYAYQSTNNSLAFISRGVLNIAHECTKAMYQFVMYKLKFKGKVKALDLAIGSDSVRILRLGSDVSRRKFGIKIEPALSRTDRDRLLEYARAMANSGLIDFRDVLILETVRTAKEARAMIEYAIKNREKENARAAQANAQAQSVAQQQTIALKAELDQRKIVLEKEKEKELLQLEYDLKLRNERDKAEVRASIESQQQNNIS